MSGSKEWADKIIADLQRVAQAAESLAPRLRPSQNLSAEQAAQAARLDPKAVAEALAEALKEDNSHTQAISVRAHNIRAKYPQRGY